VDDLSKAFARKHAIDEDVWLERGYYRYAKGDPQGLLKEAWPERRDLLEAIEEYGLGSPGRAPALVLRSRWVLGDPVERLLDS